MWRTGGAEWNRRGEASRKVGNCTTAGGAKRSLQGGGILKETNDAYCGNDVVDDDDDDDDEDDNDGDVDEEEEEERDDDRRERRKTKRSERTSTLHARAAPHSSARGVSALIQPMTMRLTVTVTARPASSHPVPCCDSCVACSKHDRSFGWMLSPAADPPAE